ncbi:MAG: sulfite exporter TauE/SafE family protein, partial [Bdellovibrionota bacterium]
AMRAAFLIRAGLTKEAFIATGVVIAFLVDLTRISVYAANFSVIGFQQNRLMLLLATLAAFTGSFVGARLVKKVTLRTIQLLVAVMLVGIAIMMGLGLI